MRKKLSKRETQVVKLLLAEYTQAEIARLLKLSSNRVHDVKRIIFEKWGVESMVGLAREAIKRGILELEDDTFEEPEKQQNQAPEFVYTYTVK